MDARLSPASWQKDPAGAAGYAFADEDESYAHGKESTSSSTTFLVPRQVASLTRLEEGGDSKKSSLRRLHHAHSEAGVVQFSRLQVSTNLNAPPSNWLYPHPDGIEQLQGFHATPHYTGFSSFRMAAQFLELFKDVDVMADAEIIKKLLKMPYSKAPVSLLVHKVGQTLLIDDFDIHGFLLRSSAEEWKWLKKFFYETVFKSIEQKKKALVRRSTKNDAIQSRNLMSKFLYYSLETSAAKEEKASSEHRQSDKIDSEEGGKSQRTEENKVVKLPPLPEPSVEAKMPDSQAASHEFARHLLWNFEDIRMLIGSDMPIFGDSEHPAVSLRLHDKKKPINILTGLDYWLDNLMCQVPEVLMCYHIDGIVQRYELIKTEDLPNLESCQFSPHTVRDVAKNILSFLKSNAAKEGHTYWLFKGKEDDFVKLYDLTSLCTETKEPSSSDSNASTRQPDKEEDEADEGSAKEDFQNPFRTAVSMLLYKVARNLLQSPEREKEEGTVRQLLENCLSLLDKEKFPHIATSTHFMLSDLYIPDNVDPSCPIFPAENNLDSFGDDADEVVEECKPESSTKLVEVQALRLPHKGPIHGEAFRSQPMPACVKERCHSALTHVVEGLQFLDVLMKRRKEEAAREDKKREQMERDNPKMSRPYVPIPMPYDDPKSKEVNSFKAGKSIKSRTRFHSESLVQSLNQQVKLSWHDHLKLVLLKKAFLVYITLSETNFVAANYGGALRCVKRALNCYKMIKVINPSFQDKSFVLSFAFGVAGDSYMAMVRNWGSMVTYQEEYNSMSEFDVGIFHAIEKCVDEDLRDWMIKLPQDIEESLLLAYKCFKHGLGIVSHSIGEEMQKDYRDLVLRLGNANNELGVFYMSQAAILTRELEGKLPEGVKNLFEKSMTHLKEGMENFDAAGDNANRALLNSNCGRIHRLYAFTFGQVGGCGEDGTEAGGRHAAEFSRLEEEHYKRAIHYYETALNTLGSRRRNLNIWDTVSWELSSTLFVMGTQLQDFAPLSTEPKSDIQKQVTELLMKALKYCDLETPGTRLEMYQYRAACIHYRLATMYNKHLMSSPDVVFKEGCGRGSHHLKRLAESHYAKCTQLYFLIDHHNEYLRAQLELVAMHEHCLDRATNGNAKVKAFSSVFEAFAKCLPVLSAFSNDSVALSTASDQECLKGEDSGKDDSGSEERLVLLQLLMRRLQQDLLELNKFFLGVAAGGKKGAKKEDSKWAKQLYRDSLQCAETVNEAKCSGTFVKDICELLKKVASEISERLK